MRHPPAGSNLDCRPAILAGFVVSFTNYYTVCVNSSRVLNGRFSESGKAAVPLVFLVKVGNISFDRSHRARGVVSVRVRRTGRSLQALLLLVALSATSVGRLFGQTHALVVQQRGMEQPPQFTSLGAADLMAVGTTGIDLGAQPKAAALDQVVTTTANLTGRSLPVSATMEGIEGLSASVTPGVLGAGETASVRVSGQVPGHPGSYTGVLHLYGFNRYAHFALAVSLEVTGCGSSSIRSADAITVNADRAMEGAAPPTEATDLPTEATALPPEGTALPPEATASPTGTAGLPMETPDLSTPSPASADTAVAGKSPKTVEPDACKSSAATDGASAPPAEPTGDPAATTDPGAPPSAAPTGESVAPSEPTPPIGEPAATGTPSAVPAESLTTPSETTMAPPPAPTPEAAAPAPTATPPTEAPATVPASKT
jgi:hypothetical protein